MLVFVTDAKVVKVCQCARFYVEKYALSIFLIDNERFVDMCNTDIAFKKVVGVIYE